MVLWNSIKDLKVKLVALITPPTTNAANTPPGIPMRISIAIEAIKFLQNVIMWHTSQDSTVFSLNDISSAHPLLSASELTEEGVKHLDFLYTQATSTLSNTVFITLITILMTIGKARDFKPQNNSDMDVDGNSGKSSFREQILFEFFVKLASLLREKFSRTPAHLKSAQKSLRLAIFNLVKLTTKEWTREFTSMLNDLGIKQHCERMRPQAPVASSAPTPAPSSAPVTSTNDLSADAPTLMVQSEDVDQVELSHQSYADIRQNLLKNMPVSMNVTPEIQTQLKFLSNLPLQTAVNLVEHGIRLLPWPDGLQPLDIFANANAPPAFDGTDLIRLFAAALSPESHVKQKFIPQVRLRAGEIHHHGRRHSLGSTSTSASNQAEDRMELDEKGHKRKSLVGAMQQSKRRAVSSLRDSNKPEARKVPSSESSASTQETGSSELQLQAPALTKKSMSSISSITFSRLISSEQGVKKSGEAVARLQILAQLVSRKNIADPAVQYFVDHICADFPSRMQMALYWLFSEWSIKAEEGKRYNFILKKILSVIKPLLKTAANDKLITNFLMLVPHVTKDVYDFLQEYCQDQERLSFGLFTLRDFCLQRPPCRTQSLRILLKYTAHQNEAIRTPSIRLITTNLFSHPVFTEHIIGFAEKLLKSLIVQTAPGATQNENGSSNLGASTGMKDSNLIKKEDAHMQTEQPQVKPDPFAEEQDIAQNNEINGKSTQPPQDDDGMQVDQKLPSVTSSSTTTAASTGAPTTTSSSAGLQEDVQGEGPDTSQFDDEDIKRRLLLYFALSARKNDMLAGLVDVYIQVDSKVKKMIQRQLGGLIRNIGMYSPALLQVMRTFPLEAKSFALQVLHILTEGQNPSPELVAVVKEVHDTRIPDVRFLVPILSGLSKSEILNNLPKFLDLQQSAVKNVLTRIVNQKPPAPVSPSDLLVALHLLDESAVPLRKVIDAIQICFEQKVVVRQEVLEKMLQQLIDANPLPPLLMRTVILTIGRCKQTLAFVLRSLKKLTQKSIWNDKRLWQGFIKCCKMTRPHSIPVVLALPNAQFEEVLKKMPTFKDDILNYQAKFKSKLTPEQSSILDTITSTSNEVLSEVNPEEGNTGGEDKMD